MSILIESFRNTVAVEMNPFIGKIIPEAVIDALGCGRINIAFRNGECFAWHGNGGVFAQGDVPAGGDPAMKPEIQIIMSEAVRSVPVEIFRFRRAGELADAF